MDGAHAAAPRTVFKAALGIQQRSCRRRWARQRTSLAGKLDDRTVPYTVPMKAVPQQCGPLGRIRPALRFVRGACGATSPPVPVRRLPRAGPAVQPLRPRQPLLQPAVLAGVARCGPARGGAPLPVFTAWSPGACRAISALAGAPRCWRCWRWSWCSRRTERDAPGFPARGGHCSTARMDPRHRHIEPGRRHHPRGAGPTEHRTRCALDLPPLRGGPASPGAPGLPAPCPASRRALAATRLAS